FGAMHVIDVLRGEGTDKVAQREHDKLSTFGIGRERSSREWRAIVRQCIAHGLLEVDHDAYGALRLAGDSRAVLKSERSVALRGISGIGARKLEAYGEDIVGLVRGA